MTRMRSTYFLPPLLPMLIFLLNTRGLNGDNSTATTVTVATNTTAALNGTTLPSNVTTTVGNTTATTTTVKATTVRTTRRTTRRKRRTTTEADGEYDSDTTTRDWRNDYGTIRIANTPRVRRIQQALFIPISRKKVRIEIRTKRPIPYIPTVAESQYIDQNNYDDTTGSGRRGYQSPSNRKVQRNRLHYYGGTTPPLHVPLVNTLMPTSKTKKTKKHRKIKFKQYTPGLIIPFETDDKVTKKKKTKTTTASTSTTTGTTGPHVKATVMGVVIPFLKNTTTTTTVTSTPAPTTTHTTPAPAAG